MSVRSSALLWRRLGTSARSFTGVMKPISPASREYVEALQRLLALSDADAATVQRKVRGKSLGLGNLEPKLAYLETRLALSREQLCKVVVAMPTLLGYSVDANLEPKLVFYADALRLDKAGLAAFVCRFPTALGYSLAKRLRPRYDACVQAGMTVDLPVMNVIMVNSDDKFQRFLNKQAARE